MSEMNRVWDSGSDLCTLSRVGACVGMVVFSSTHALTQNLDPVALFGKISPSIVVVEALDPQGKVFAFGSGVVVAPMGVVTNRHVVDEASRVRVRRGATTWSAEIAHWDPDHDLVRLAVPGLTAPAVNLRLSRTLRTGERVYAIGAPEGLELTLSEGLISSLRPVEDGLLIQTTAPISHGSSGGGLFDSAGQLVGITTLTMKAGQVLNFALPADWVTALPLLPGRSLIAREPTGVRRQPRGSCSGPLRATVETTMGAFTIRLCSDLAPQTVDLFRRIAQAEGYRGTTFHRVIPGGIVQGGDPHTRDPRNESLQGTGGLGLVRAEFSERAFRRGSLGNARRPSDVNSGGYQFFICLREQPAIRGQYTLFGEVDSGMDVVDRIGAVPVQGDRPMVRIEILKVTVTTTR